MWKQVFSQVFQNMIPADTLAFVVKIVSYKERCPQHCNRETSFPCVESVETRYRSKHQGHYSLHKQAPLPTPLKDVGAVTHGNTNHNNTAYYGAFHCEKKMNILNIYFDLYMKLPVATWLFWAAPKSSLYRANREASAIVNWSLICPWSLGLESGKTR